MDLRQDNSKPIFNDLEDWLHEQLPKISGKSPLAKAIRYGLNRMPKTRPYLDNGFLELDNNTAERAMKPIALGRKNWMCQRRTKTAPVAGALVRHLIGSGRSKTAPLLGFRFVHSPAQRNAP